MSCVCLRNDQLLQQWKQIASKIPLPEETHTAEGLTLTWQYTLEME